MRDMLQLGNKTF